MYTYECLNCHHVVKISDDEMDFLTIKLDTIRQKMEFNDIPTIGILDCSMRCCINPNYLYEGRTDE